MHRCKLLEMVRIFPLTFWFISKRGFVLFLTVNEWVFMDMSLPSADQFLRCESKHKSIGTGVYCSFLRWRSPLLSSLSNHVKSICWEKNENGACINNISLEDSPVSCFFQLTILHEHAVGFLFSKSYANTYLFFFKLCANFLHAQHPSAMNSNNTQIPLSAVSVVKAAFSVFLGMLRFSNTNKFSTM